MHDYLEPTKSEIDVRDIVLKRFANAAFALSGAAILVSVLLATTDINIVNTTPFYRFYSQNSKN